MEDREKREDAGERRKDGRQRETRRCRREKKRCSKKNKKIYPFGCNINYFSYICTRKGIIILNVYL